MIFLVRNRWFLQQFICHWEFRNTEREIGIVNFRIYITAWKKTDSMFDKKSWCYSVWTHTKISTKQFCREKRQSTSYNVDLVGKIDSTLTAYLQTSDLKTSSSSRSLISLIATQLYLKNTHSRLFKSSYLSSVKLTYFTNQIFFETSNFCVNSALSERDYF